MANASVGVENQADVACAAENVLRSECFIEVVEMAHAIEQRENDDVAPTAGRIVSIASARP